MSQRDSTEWDEQLHPWSRLLARSFDLLWIIGLLDVAAKLIGLPLTNPAEHRDLLRSVVEHMITLPIALLIDALLISLASTTPGKALAGLHVCAKDGRRLILSDYASRNFGLYARGYGIGLPVISLITMWLGYSALKKHGEVPWDRSSRTWVEGSGAGAARNWLVLLAGVLLLIGFDLLFPTRPG